MPAVATLFVLLCVAGVACLTPLAVYSAWVGALNRRDRPTVIGGGTDFAAVLLALSGFVIVGGGLVVAAAQSNVRLLLRGNGQVDAALASERAAWAGTAGGYLLAVGAAAGIGVLARSRSLAVYNIEADRAAAAVDAAFASLDLSARRSGNLWSVGGDGVVELKPFDGLCHATVWLLGDDPRRAEALEAALRRELTSVPSADNPVAGWVGSVTVFLAFTILSLFLGLAYVVYLARR